MITPPIFPSWFRPVAVLEAVDDAGGGSTTFGQIMATLATKHSSKHTQVPGFDSRVLLRATLSVLHQRGYLLTCSSGQPPERHYTRRRRHAPATADIDNDLLSYYVGYKLGRGHGLDDDGTAESEGDDAANQLRRRFGNNDNHPVESEVADREVVYHPIRYSICLYFIYLCGVLNKNNIYINFFHV
jgi:hypothetical protein